MVRLMKPYHCNRFTLARLNKPPWEWTVAESNANQGVETNCALAIAIGKYLRMNEEYTILNLPVSKKLIEVATMIINKEIHARNQREEQGLVEEADEDQPVLAGIHAHGVPAAAQVAIQRDASGVLRPVMLRAAESASRVAEPASLELEASAPWIAPVHARPTIAPQIGPPRKQPRIT